MTYNYQPPYKVERPCHNFSYRYQETDYWVWFECYKDDLYDMYLITLKNIDKDKNWKDDKYFQKFCEMCYSTSSKKLGDLL